MSSSIVPQNVKTFVLDASVLLAAGRHALTAFEEHEVVIPTSVVNDLRALRRDPNHGMTVASVITALDELGEEHGVTLATGVVVNPSGGTLRVETNHVETSGLPKSLVANPSDSVRVLAVAKNLESEGRSVTLVSNDPFARTQARTSAGLRAESFRNGTASLSYDGVVRVDATPEEIEKLRRTGYLDLDFPEKEVNLGVVLDGALARVDAEKRLRLVEKRVFYNVEGKSAPQSIALDALADEDVRIVSLGGAAGTGKTFLALVAGLAQVAAGMYQKVVVFRNVHAVGQQDIGFLPGTEAEKMDPWAAAIYDQLETLMTPAAVNGLKRDGKLVVLPLTHIRGRTLNKAFIVVDEAQNLDAPVLLTALTRLGKESKVALSWDVSQRDNLSVGRESGIAVVVERLRGEPLFSHTTLTKSERSRAAELVARLLDDLDV